MWHTRYNNRLQVVAHFSSGIVERASLSLLRIAFSCVGDFHARSLFARSTIPEEKWGTTRILVQQLISLFIFANEGGKALFWMEEGKRQQTTTRLTSGEKDFLTAKSHAGNTINLCSQRVSLDWQESFLYPFLSLIKWFN